MNKKLEADELVVLELGGNPGRVKLCLQRKIKHLLIWLNIDFRVNFFFTLVGFFL